MDQKLPNVAWPYVIACGDARVYWYPYYDETEIGERGWAFHGELNGIVEVVVYADEVKERTPLYRDVLALLGSHTDECVVNQRERGRRSERLKVWSLDHERHVYGNHGNVVKS